jgi:hypothetical protein
LFSWGWQKRELEQELGSHKNQEIKKPEAFALFEKHELFTESLCQSNQK